MTSWPTSENATGGEQDAPRGGEDPGAFRALAAASRELIAAESVAELLDVLAERAGQLAAAEQVEIRRGPDTSCSHGTGCQVMALTDPGGDQLGSLHLLDPAPEIAGAEHLLRELVGLAAGALARLERQDQEAARTAELRRQFSRSNLLSDLSRRLSESLEREDVLDAIAVACIPELSDLVVVHLRPGPGSGPALTGTELDPVRIAHRDPEQARLMAAVAEHFPSSLEDPLGPGAVARTGQPELLPGITRQLRVAASKSGNEAHALEGLDLSWIYILPLTVGGQTIGTITFGRRAGHRQELLDIELAEEMARRAALNLQHARAYESQRELARREHLLLTRVELALETNQLGTWEWDLASGTVTWSPTLEEIYGLAPGSFPGTFEAYIERIHPADRAEARAHADNALNRGQRFRYAYRIIRADGQVRWIEGSGQPVRGEGGDTTAVIGICQDITERRIAEVNLLQDHMLVEALHQSGLVLSSQLELDEVLRKVVVSACERVRCRVGLLWYDATEGPLHQLVRGDGGGNTTEPTEVSEHPVGPRLLRLAHLMAEGLTADSGAVRVDDLAALQAARATGSQLAPSELADSLAAEGDLLSELLSGDPAVRSVLVAPLLGDGGRVCGGLLLGHDSAHGMSGLDSRMLAGIAGQASIAIDNARLYGSVRAESDARKQALEDLQEVASALQQSLLPPQLPELPGLQLAARYLPAGTGMDVGGDFYDLFQTDDDTWHIILGDVCGKGPEAAAQTGLTRHVLRSAALRREEPEACLKLLNQALRQEETQRFVTVAHLVLDVSEVVRCTVSLGGHPHPLLLRNGKVRRLGRPGTLIGVFDDPAFRPESTQLEPGDVLVAYTDGITDQPGGHPFDESAFEAFLATCSGGAHEIMADLTTELERHAAGASQSDDIAIVAISLPVDSPLC